MADAVHGVLERCLNDAGYTPPVRALGGLIEALMQAVPEQVETLERALGRAGEAAVPAALAALPVLGVQTRLVSLLARLAGETQDERLLEPLCAALSALEPMVQRLAARGLGKLGRESAEPALLRALSGAQLPEQKSIVDALGNVGSARSLDALRALPASDAELLRRRERARLLIERRSVRTLPAGLVLGAALGRPCTVAALCRRGLAEIVLGELRARGIGSAARQHSAARVDFEYAGTLAQLYGVRSAVEFALVVPLAAGEGEEPAERIASALVQPSTLGMLARWTSGVPRFRVSWTEAGHRRALSWALARAVAARTQALVNDSQQVLWTLYAPPSAQGELLLVPRVDPDPRFTYRVREVRAASHPTLAAALARVAGVRADDVVWDPFVGSGLELVERARLGPYAELWGSDTDPEALAAARANIQAAGVSAAKLELADARRFAPPGVSLIITNPPMGRRVARDGSLATLLMEVVSHAAKMLAPSGRMVWLSPLARQTTEAARSAGLQVENGSVVDMGGFEATLQVLKRP